GDCHVITNRHVVETDGARVASTVVDTPEMRWRIESAEQQLRANVAQQLQLRNALQGQPGTNLQVLEIDERIQAMRAELADLPGRVRGAISDKVEGSGRSGFTVILVDGTEYRSLHAHYAEGRDLAMFQLPADHCPHLEPGDSSGLAQGERLYTIGNPSGLAYSVTSGVFSGDRGAGQQRMLDRGQALLDRREIRAHRIVERRQLLGERRQLLGERPQIDLGTRGEALLEAAPPGGPLLARARVLERHVLVVATEPPVSEQGAAGGGQHEQEQDLRYE